MEEEKREKVFNSNNNIDLIYKLKILILFRELRDSILVSKFKSLDKDLFRSL